MARELTRGMIIVTLVATSPAQANTDVQLQYVSDCRHLLNGGIMRPIVLGFGKLALGFGDDDMQRR